MNMEPLAGGFQAAAVAQPLFFLGIFAIIAILFVIVKWGLPHRTSIQEKKLELDKYKLQIEEKANDALDARERDRIEVNQQLIDAQRDNTKALEGMTAQFAASTAQTASLNAQLKDSKKHSNEMYTLTKDTADTTAHIYSTTRTIEQKVDEIHEIVKSSKS